MVKTGNICEQCGKNITEAFKCNRCGMVICRDCLRKTRSRVPPCNCVWDNCNGWLEPVVNPEKVPAQ